MPDAARQTLTTSRQGWCCIALSNCTGLTIYFADPHSPWQRGICEIINSLLRQYFLRGTDLSVHLLRANDVAWVMNNRPR
ncbi:hypothetical protein ACFOLC_15175 [Lysobacter cavernae]|uniref:Integrase catalytic domain-containing protein n=1 Tax=Lysobacter cavernae TaxID=1685901 RepID=A0ABV7RUQ8_9GAMM